MPRVIKHPDQRRSEILDLAMAAFLRSGYDNVSLNEIISNAGVSKGAFYHWFASKEALIAALAERNAHQGYTLVEDAVNRCTGDALERLNILLEVSFDVKVQMGVPEVLAAMTALLRPENAYLYERIVKVSMLLTVIEAVDGSTRNKAIEALATRYRLHGYAIDRILGLPDGSTRALTRDQVRVMCAGQNWKALS
jgi:TetR/AcrR family transcriptional regulator, cholesterol catabolism regulator